MYNAHRPPVGVPGPAPNARLGELLDQVRAEFEGQATRAVDYEQQRMFAFTSHVSCRWSDARSHCAAECGQSTIYSAQQNGELAAPQDILHDA